MRGIILKSRRRSSPGRESGGDSGRFPRGQESEERGGGKRSSMFRIGSGAEGSADGTAYLTSLPLFSMIIQFQVPFFGAGI